MNGPKKKWQVKWLETNKSKNTKYKNIRDAVKVIPSSKFSTVNTYIKSNNKLITQFYIMRN